jgi:Tol biopolymer transport system component
MKTQVLFLILAVVAAAQEPRLQNLKQLTFGGSNAEAYFSPDGSKIVFQSTREGYKCDQIFVMNADGSDQRLVSTGKGRTTCGYFFPDGQHIIYASTHEGGADCPPEVDRSKGYLWAVYATYELYKATLDGKIVGKLAAHEGYDAEATINWKTRKIVWTSTRDGDLNLWTGGLDLKKPKAVTTRLGYDGGAFFSPDGKKLVWRANYPRTPEAEKDYKEKLAQNLTAPMKMEIFTADASGKNVRQVTNFGCASFAPAFTADGQRIIFSSNKNKCDSRYFDLFIMNADGSGVEQVTHTGAFNSFPMFSPDGRKLVFISDRNAKARFEYNVFIAEWKD